MVVLIMLTPSYLPKITVNLITKLDNPLPCKTSIGKVNITILHCLHYMVHECVIFNVSYKCTFNEFVDHVTLIPTYTQHPQITIKWYDWFIACNKLNLNLQIKNYE